MTDHELEVAGLHLVSAVGDDAGDALGCQLVDDIPTDKTSRAKDRGDDALVGRITWGTLESNGKKKANTKKQQNTHKELLGFSRQQQNCLRVNLSSDCKTAFSFHFHFANCNFAFIFICPYVPPFPELKCSGIRVSRSTNLEMARTWTFCAVALALALAFCTACRCRARTACIVKLF